MASAKYLVSDSAVSFDRALNAKIEVIEAFSDAAAGHERPFLCVCKSLHNFSPLFLDHGLAHRSLAVNLFGEG